MPLSAPRIRYSFAKEGQASPWYELPLNKAGQAARKHFGLTYGLWQYLKDRKKLVRTTQQLNDATRVWEQVSSRQVNESTPLKTHTIGTI
jgi:hypothetical protein